MAARTEPLSIESLLQKQREEKEAASKVCVESSRFQRVHYVYADPYSPSFFQKKNERRSPSRNGLRISGSRRKRKRRGGWIVTL
jgi:hypothetical protein